jgi:hypothetical protein
MLNHLFLQFSVVFFVSEYILYSMFNHLSRRILSFLSLGDRNFTQSQRGRFTVAMQLEQRLEVMLNFLQSLQNSYLLDCSTLL